MVAAFANLDHSDVLWVDEHNEGSCPCGRVTETQRDREVLTTEARNDLTSHSKIFGLDYSEKEAIEACPLAKPSCQDDHGEGLNGLKKDHTLEILYRGSIPAERNLLFLRKRRIRTIVYLNKKALKEDDGLVMWAKRRKMDLRWIKADKIGEEALGVGKSEVNEVLKVMLDVSCYPLYIADVDGISHTSLLVACLRKLQGWHMDSIVNEICRFEPDHDDYNLIPFIQTYLSSSDSTFTLPPPPYPSWLWPTLSTTAQATVKGDTSLSRSTTLSVKERERSNTTTSQPGQTQGLPFPHPLQARRHPTMKLTFPPQASSPLLPSSTNALSRVPTLREKEKTRDSQEDRAGGVAQSIPGTSGTVVASEDKRANGSNPPSVIQNKGSRLVQFQQDQGTAPVSSSSLVNLEARATAASSVNPSRVNSLGPDTDPGSTSQSSEGQSAREATTDELETYQAEAMYVSGTPEEMSTEDEPFDELDGGDVMEEDDEDEDEDEDDDDDDDDDDDLQPTSQYISALDLAGY